MRTLIALVLIAITVTARAEAQQPGHFQIIVNPQNAVTSADRKVLTDIFLKRKSTWPDGEVIRPVDLGESPVRQRFSTVVLGRSVAQVRNYWQQRIFTGRELPPPELPSDQDVLKYVLANPGAIGYVSATANIDGAKVVVLRAD